MRRARVSLMMLAAVAVAVGTQSLAHAGPQSEKQTQGEPDEGIRFQWPLCARIVSGFGYRVDPFTDRVAYHAGLDIGDGEGIDVRAAAVGRVIAAEDRGPYGLMVEIDHDADFLTRYAHLQTILVKEGALISAGDRVGLTGSTGRASSPRLHFEIWLRGIVRDPLKYLSPTDCPRAGEPPPQVSP